ncbi:PrsW family intramembrane metalloprotease [Halorubrum sp. Atlit-28R]|jgi:RsiW-degrading membrane proteinase PrsW (M82 family)|uniref:PrsW family intramembrane metalloprotease n=1 Tax=Halorubrum sp. Atlit-28R TaxID=2282129 RepID=UPI000EF2462E|nr:PrsW family intramembrane metalloprotease [Halorubrum sp. Atlit-28R]RLM49293.1 protease PrsW [Halorubrum sp. Atlit-28R]
MPSEQDPIASRADDDRDLYDVATWEERTSLDGLSVALYWLLTRSAKAGVVFVAFVGLLAILGSFGLGLIFDPAIAILLGLSAVPALGLAAYVYRSDVTTAEPLSLLVATFLLSILTATFAAILNSVLQPYFRPFGFLGLVVFFFVVVGPIEETVKLLAVRLYAYTDDRFDAVIDGAVYGALAGLGFVVIENFVYIAQNVDMGELSVGIATLGAGDGIAALRALAGPGHVVYSAFAGYYLGLAKFNPENRGPIIVKGLVLAAAIHALYNTLVGPVTGVASGLLGLPQVVALFGFVLVFQGTFGYVLLRKIWRYRDAYLDTRDAVGEDVAPELDEFEQ